MKKNSPSFVKWVSTRKKQPRRMQLTSKKPTAVERTWLCYLKGGHRPPLTCIVTGGIEMEKKYISIKWS